MHDSSFSNNTPKQYDTAINVIRWVAACAEVAEEKLKNGKRTAQKKLRDKQKESSK